MYGLFQGALPNIRDGRTTFAYLARTMTCSGRPMSKSLFYPSLISVGPTHRPGRIEASVDLDGKSEPKARIESKRQPCLF